MKIISLLCALFLFLPHSARGGLDCAEEFSKVKPAASAYKLSPADRNLIEKVCSKSSNRDVPYILSLMKEHPPEFGFYLVSQCASTVKGLSEQIQFGTSQFIKGYPKAEYPGAPDGALWAKLRTANPSFEGVPSEWVAKWKASAVAAFRREKNKEASNTYLGIALPGDLIYRTKMALPFLREEEVQEAVRLAARNYAVFLGRSHVLAGIFPPKAFQFAKNGIRRELGLEFNSLSDFIVTYTEDALQPRILSLDKPSSKYGSSSKIGIFHSLNLPTLPISNSRKAGSVLTKQTVDWKANNRNYSADIKITLGQPVSELAPVLTSLDYRGMWADRKFTGMVFPGANMGVGEAGAHDVMNNYRDYFQDNGFRFGPTKPISNVQEFMDAEVTSGRLDYLIKEAHAAGADTSLVQIPENGSLLTGVKKLPGGKEEVVHIFYPNTSKLKEEAGEDLTYATLKEWMNKRREGGGKQLFVVDTSCFGIRTMCKLTAAVQDPNLVVAGSESSLETFANESGSGMTVLLDGLRGRKPFAKIKPGTALNEEGSAPDVYALPGSKAWKDGIYGKFQRSFDMEINVTENGIPVTVETMGRDSR